MATGIAGYSHLSERAHAGIPDRAALYSSVYVGSFLSQRFRLKVGGTSRLIVVWAEPRAQTVARFQRWAIQERREQWSAW